MGRLPRRRRTVVPRRPRHRVPRRPDTAFLDAPDTAFLDAPDTAFLDAPDTAFLDAPDTAFLDAPDTAFLDAPDTAFLDAPDTAFLDAPDTAFLDAPEAAAPAMPSVWDAPAPAMPSVWDAPVASAFDTPSAAADPWDLAAAALPATAEPVDAMPPTPTSPWATLDPAAPPAVPDAVSTVPSEAIWDFGAAPSAGDPAGASGDAAPSFALGADSPSDPFSDDAWASSAFGQVGVTPTGAREGDEEAPAEAPRHDGWKQRWGTGAAAATDDAAPTLDEQAGEETTPATGRRVPWHRFVTAAGLAIALAGVLFLVTGKRDTQGTTVAPTVPVTAAPTPTEPAPTVAPETVPATIPATVPATVAPETVPAEPDPLVISDASSTEPPAQAEPPTGEAPAAGDGDALVFGN